MKKTVDNLIQNLKNTGDESLLKEKLELIFRNEFNYRMSVIDDEVEKTKKIFFEQLHRGVGSIVSLIFSILWIFIVLPIKVFGILFLVINLPIQCYNHKQLIKNISNHPEFQKIKKG